jgi:hypothetical protein
MAVALSVVIGCFVVLVDKSINPGAELGNDGDVDTSDDQFRCVSHFELLGLFDNRR